MFMKKTMRLFIALILLAATQVKAQDISKVEWLVGTWTRTNAKPGRSGVEVWKKVGNELVGRGISLKGADTTFVEKLKITTKDGKLFYVSDVPENKEPTWFGFTSVAERNFSVEDPKHDFPKKITYEVDGKNLKATISGDGKSIEYLFERSN